MYVLVVGNSLEPLLSEVYVWFIYAVLLTIVRAVNGEGHNFLDISRESSETSSRTFFFIAKPSPLGFRTPKSGRSMPNSPLH